ncbi:MAG: tetraacyldisaccharide 4'-kinase [Rhodospirillales bacterium]|nr:tetraacyldisaccharide 4'-kinase [Rhodospirillales bacterium]
MRAPNFWAAESGGVAAAALTPLSWLYRLGARSHAALARPSKAERPVICVGNFTVGGTGKTPTVLALAALLAEEGVRPHILTRGYRGSERGPLRVDPAHHTADAVGDEALLLARETPTWLCRDRPAGAAAAASAGADVLLMDDGMQTPGLAKDFCFAVVDGGAGFGNGRLLPAGPLREPLACGLGRAHALVLVGVDREGVLAALGPHDLPVIEASLMPGDEIRTLREQPIVAFAGIGRPEKFFETLAENGCNVIAQHAFADHHRYKPGEIAAIVDQAKERDAVPVTTEKDHVRLPLDSRAAVRTLSVTLAWRDPAEPRSLLAPLVTRCRRG